MGEFGNSDLTMKAPQLAREKVSSGKHKVFCWAPTCPELLATRDGWSLEVAAGYELGKDRVLLKSRRSASRQRNHRQAIELVERNLEAAVYPQSIEDNEKARKTLLLAQRSRDTYFKTGYMLEHDDLPVIIRCSRCGRLSKIVEAKQRS